MKIGVAVLCYGGWLRKETFVSAALDLLWAQGDGHELAIYPPDMHGADRARNWCVAKAREDDLDLLLMMDNDTAAEPTSSVLEAMVSTMREREATAVCAAVITNGHGFVPNVAPVVPHEVYEAQKAGAAYLLLDMRRLEEIGPNHVWFRWELADDGLTVKQSEDLYFTRKVQKRGGKVIVNFRIPTIHAIPVPLEMSKILAAMAAKDDAPKIVSPTEH